MLSLRDRRFSPGRFMLNVDPLHTARPIFYPQHRQRNVLTKLLPGQNIFICSVESHLIFRKFRIFIFFIRFCIDIFLFVSYYNYIKGKGGRTTENLI